jgi:hypothetical protein
MVDLMTKKSERNPQVLTKIERSILSDAKIATARGEYISVVEVMGGSKAFKGAVRWLVATGRLQLTEAQDGLVITEDGKAALESQ